MVKVRKMYVKPNSTKLAGWARFAGAITGEELKFVFQRATAAAG
jgi:hypothetical protein